MDCSNFGLTNKFTFLIVSPLWYASLTLNPTKISIGLPVLAASFNFS